MCGGGDDIAAAGVLLADEGDGGGVAGADEGSFAVGVEDFGDACADAGGEDDDLIAGADFATGDFAHVAAEVHVGPTDELDGKTHGTARSAVVDFEALEEFEHRGAGVPGHLGGAGGDVVAGEGGQGDGGDGGVPAAGGADALDDGLEVGDDLVEAVLRPVDEVDLVDGEDDVSDAEEGDDVGVAAGLGDDAVAGVDEEDGDVGGGGAGGHVAGVLLVAGAVGDDEGAVGGGEVAVGDVDGDALFTLGFEAIGEEGEVELSAGGAVSDGGFFDGGELVFEDAFGVVEQSPDEGGLAVIDGAAGDESEEG